MYYVLQGLSNVAIVSTLVGVKNSAIEMLEKVGVKMSLLQTPQSPATKDSSTEIL